MAEDRTLMTHTEVESAHECIRVAVVGGARLYRAALRHLMQSVADLQIIAESKTAFDVASLSDDVRGADVVLLDIDDGLLHPLDLLEQVQATGGAAVLLLAGDVEQDVIDPLILGGARGVVFKDAAEDHLLSAIRKVHRGELWLGRGAASRLISALADLRRVVAAESERSRIEALSPREREVVAFVADGLCNKSIARNMGISDNTVRHHLTSIYSKLGTRDRLELVIYAFRQGVVKPAV